MNKILSNELLEKNLKFAMNSLNFIMHINIILVVILQLRIQLLIFSEIVNFMIYSIEVLEILLE